MTEEWRCPNAQDGAFHVVDASTLDPEKYTYPCIHCGEQVGFELVNNGMARARGGFVNPAAVPHDGYNLGPTLKVGGKADTFILDSDSFHSDFPEYEINWEPANLSVTGVWSIPDESWLFTLNGPQGLLVQIGYDGKIEYGPHYTPDEAARIFWEAIGTIAPFVGR